MGDPVQAVRYLKSHIIFCAFILLSYTQAASSSQALKANANDGGCSGVVPALGKGNRKTRQGSESSTSSSDPIESLVDPETLANGEGQLIGPAAARELDKKNKKNKDVEKEDGGSLNIKIHLDLHAKVKLDLEADLYGDIVIGLL